MTLLAIRKSQYQQREIRDELLNQIAIRIPTMNHLYPHPPTTPHYYIQDEKSLTRRKTHHLSEIAGIGQNSVLKLYVFINLTNS